MWFKSVLVLGWGLAGVCLADGGENAGNFFTTVNANQREVHNGTLSEDAFPNWAAKAFYNSSNLLTGFDLLEITTNYKLSDDDQMYEAGFLEGYLTAEKIYYYWYNTLKTYCVNTTKTCEKVDNFLKKNSLYIKNMAKNNGDDPYWYQIHLYYMQMQGIYEGYKEATKNDKNRTLTKNDILWLNVLLDIQGDLKAALAVDEEKQFVTKLDHCSALIKLLPGYKDVIFAHTAWNQYSTMNRILKRYQLSVHEHNNSLNLIEGSSMTFSSYPGSISSVDDFYLISSGLVAIETTNNNYDVSNYKHINPSTVLESVRSVIANRISSSGSMWASFFSRGNSGTYNNQWMIIDLNKFTPGEQPKEGFLWIIEQMPNKIASADQTEHIIGATYWASYNIPFYKDIYEYSGTAKMWKKYGDYFSYDNYARAKQFSREHTKVKDVSTMYNTIRFNNYTQDKYSICDVCSPKPNPALAIASRYDLYNGTSKYPYPGFGLVGAIDAKVSSFSMVRRGQEIMVAGGPTTSNSLPPFSWKDHENQALHMGQPEVWNFQPFTSSWTSIKEKVEDKGSGGQEITLSMSVIIYCTLTMFLLN